MPRDFQPANPQFAARVRRSFQRQGFMAMLGPSSPWWSPADPPGFCGKTPNSPGLLGRLGFGLPGRRPPAPGQDAPLLDRPAPLAYPEQELDAGPPYTKPIRERCT